MRELILRYGKNLSEDDIAHLHMLVGDWQVLSDIASADLILWIPDDRGRYLAIAHTRPATGFTIHLDDVVGLAASPMRSGMLSAAFAPDSKPAVPEVRWAGSYSVIASALPVRHEGRIVAALTLEVNIQSLRVFEQQEQWFHQTAKLICEMISRGVFPSASVPPTSMHGMPRLIDGAISLDAEGRVLELTPNARSCLRRLGLREEVNGEVLAELITEVVQDQSQVDEALPVVIMGKASWVAEVESPAGTVSFRALPLEKEGERVGALLLCRDVSEMRRRERELMTKDATIREIHHRVKNNLQTVSALLRMQIRRSDSPEVKAALGEAERRVASIARVHEELSQTVNETVDFDNMISRLLRMAAAMAATDQEVKTIFKGSFGVIDADTASVLAVVISELVANGVEHGLGGNDGTVTLEAKREGNELDVWVRDDGVGLGDKPLSGLGTSIVRTLVRGNLKGTIDWSSPEQGGTQAHIHAHVEEETK
ncbi:sensor histidine kinase [Varibaculum massiliense]|uniref:sensor histidine kinase n=1 Tax=Varibaculum massiliense TaxID=1852372 RepID=UPI0008D95F15|nr:PAS domain-containing sensor histidine kinase [Varibaculum massiliense]